MTTVGRADREYLLAWREFADGSPLYWELVTLIADSVDLLDIIGRVHRQPPPNVFLAAVQYLLMEDPTHPLADFYASFTDDPKSRTDVSGPFHDFVTEHQDRIVEIANSRYTQTNECRRCVALLPAVMSSPFQEFHLVDMGTSAGLNLALDRYGYDFAGTTWGPRSSLTLHTEMRGDAARLRDLDILSRTGLDVNIIDLGDEGDRMWLDALIWPEHRDRRSRLRSALEIASDVEMEMIEGDVLETLGPVLDQFPPGDPVVIINSFILNQFTLDQRQELDLLVDRARSQRRVFRVSLEAMHKGDTVPRLEVGEDLELETLGTAHQHGDWLDLTYG